MSIIDSLTDLTKILSDLSLGTDNSLRLKSRAHRKYESEYYSKYRISNDEVAKIQADKAIWSLCSDLYDYHKRYGEGEIIFPKTVEHEHKTTEMSDSVLLPVDLSDEMYMSTMVNWAALYSQLTVFVLPLSISSLDISYSGAFGARTSFNVIEKLLYLNKKFEPLVASKRGVFLPSSTTYEYTSLSSYSSTTYKVPLEQSSTYIKFTPLNLSKTLQKEDDSRNIQIYKNIYLPYFSNLRLAEVIRLAENETDAFVKFNHFLKKKLSTNASSSSLKDIQECVDEIEYEMAKLNVEIERISKLRSLQKAQILTLVLSLGALMFSDVTLVKSLAGIIGSVNLMHLIEKYVASKIEQISLKKSDVYLLYLIRNKK